MRSCTGEYKEDFMAQLKMEMVALVILTKLDCTTAVQFDKNIDM